MKLTNFDYEDAEFFLTPPDMPPFWVFSAGITYCDETFQVRRECSVYTVLEYIYSGTGLLQTEQGEYHPSAGDLYILPEKSSHFYRTDAAEPWTKIFVNVTGTAFPGILQAYGLHKKVLYRNCRELAPVFEEIFRVVKSSADMEQIMEQCNMLVNKLLHRLCQQERQSPNVPAEIQKVKRFIDNNYRKNLTMDQIAGCVYRSNDYIKKRFKHYYGVTPYAYYLDVKITQAKYLLQRTSLPIKQIADRLGYKSDVYFSKRFHEAVGMTASEFRNREGL